MDRPKILLLTSVVAVIIGIAARIKKKRTARLRKTWSRQWLERRNQGKGVLHMVDSELKLEDPDAYRNFLRMTSVQFIYLLDLISPIIDKQDTNMRECISSKHKLELTLRFLATGESFRSLMYYSRIHETTISRFIPIVCTAICCVLRKKYMKIPTNANEWLTVSEEFDRIWQFPHCLGALDGRHITFKAPISAGSYYYNYKGTHSIVLLGLVDAMYRFIYVNIGVNGRISDGGVFGQSGLADDAFPLSVHLMKPYPERGLSHDMRIFNYRLSRARRIVENAFGILANRFRVLLNPIGLSVDKVELITKTCVTLHNFLATENRNNYSEVNMDQYQQLPRIGNQGGNRCTNAATQVREQFKIFFNTPAGSVPWQEESIRGFNY